jgi:hypothetical protein
VTIYYYANPTRYVFPLQVGKGWRGAFVNDSSTVTQRGPVSVPAGIFQNGFQIHERWSGLNDFGDISTWLVPRVGLIDLHRREYVGVRITWKLISYNIAP